MWRGGCPTKRQKQTVTAQSLISQTFFLLWLSSVYTLQQAQTSKASSRDVRADVTSQTLSTRDHQGKETQSESRDQCSGRTLLEALASRMFSWHLHTDPTSGVKSATKNMKDSPTAELHKPMMGGQRELSHTERLSWNFSSRMHTVCH